jgi:hypothetical protein
MGVHKDTLVTNVFIFEWYPWHQNVCLDAIGHCTFKFSQFAIIKHLSSSQLHSQQHANQPSKCNNEACQGHKMMNDER